MLSAQCYLTQILQEHFVVLHFLILFLNSCSVEEFFKRVGSEFHIRLPLNTNEFVPNVVDLEGRSCKMLLFLKIYG